MLEINELVVGYSDEHRVLSGVSLNVNSHTVLAVMGRNGAGKTTMCRALLGFLRPQHGCIQFGGEKIIGLPAHEIFRRGISYVPQGREVFCGLTVEENLRLAMYGAGRGDWDLAWEYFPALIPLQKRTAGDLSGGEQQLLALARALVVRPKLIVLDEPSLGLQPSLLTELGATLSAISSAEGVSVLLVEQNLELVRSTARTCVFLEDGRTVDTMLAQNISVESPELQRHLAL